MSTAAIDTVSQFLKHSSNHKDLHLLLILPRGNINDWTKVITDQYYETTLRNRKQLWYVLL